MDKDEAMRTYINTSPSIHGYNTFILVYRETSALPNTPIMLYTIVYTGQSLYLDYPCRGKNRQELMAKLFIFRGFRGGQYTDRVANIPIKTFVFICEIIFLVKLSTMYLYTLNVNNMYVLPGNGMVFFFCNSRPHYPKLQFKLPGKRK